MVNHSDMRYLMNLVSYLVKDHMPVGQGRPVPLDQELEKAVRSMEERGIKHLIEQGKSREEAVRLTREAMDAPLPQKVPSFDEL